jgi:hypothetical protein
MNANKEYISKKEHLEQLLRDNIIHEDDICIFKELHRSMWRYKIMNRRNGMGQKIYILHLIDPDSPTFSVTLWGKTTVEELQDIL